MFAGEMLPEGNRCTIVDGHRPLFLIRHSDVRNAEPIRRGMQLVVEADLRSVGKSDTTRTYIGVDCYDKNYTQISSAMAGSQEGTASPVLSVVRDGTTVILTIANDSKAATSGLSLHVHRNSQSIQSELPLSRIDPTNFSKEDGSLKILNAPANFEDSIVIGQAVVCASKSSAAYRYPIGNSSGITIDRNWKHYCGVLSGFGTEEHMGSRFRPETEYFRVIVLANYKNPEGAMAIANLRYYWTPITPSETE